MKTMGQRETRDRAVVWREHADSYLLVYVVSFGATVVAVRVFLQWTGFPQIGNSVLHIAHALWGGMMLCVAGLLPVLLANRWAVQAGALLSGMGTGLFIDEVGKFVTQANDYFYPPALPIIYGFLLLSVLAFLYLRRPRHADARSSMYHVLEGLKDVLDGGPEAAPAASMAVRFTTARQSLRPEIAALAETLEAFLQREQRRLPAAKPDIWRRLADRVDAVGRRPGRRAHWVVVTLMMFMWLLFVIGFVAILALDLLVADVPSLDPQVVQWRTPLIAIQIAIGAMMLVAIATWLMGKVGAALRWAVLGLLVSLVAFQAVYFYLSQFAAITFALLQFAFLVILIAYRRWYVPDIL